jgi:hypothetical protein
MEHPLSLEIGSQYQSRFNAETPPLHRIDALHGSLQTKPLV